jgi:hypothetical protein
LLTLYLLIPILLGLKLLYYPPTFKKAYLQALRTRRIII